MNRRFWIFAIPGLLLLALTQLHHVRPDARTIRISVPDMATDRDIRIITNAALDQVRGSYDGFKHEYLIDHARHAVIYHGGPELLSPDFHRAILQRIGEIGHTARIAQVGPDPLPPVRTKSGELYDSWPGRITAIITVPDMKTNLDANRIIAAISLARTGDDPAHIAPDPGARTLTVTLNSLHIAPQYIQHAIACSGYTANDIPARYGRPDAEPFGWQPY